MEQNNISQSVNSLFSNLENFTQKDGVLGKPVTHEKKTFIPVVSVTMGYGTGNTANKNANHTSSLQSSDSVGGALGLGAKLNTEAVIVIDESNVSMMPIDKATNTNSKQLIDKIPQMIMGLSNKKQNQDQDNQTTQQQTSSKRQNQSQ